MPKMLLGSLCVLAALAACAGPPHGAAPMTSEGPALVMRATGDSARYAVLLPVGYSSAARWPAILFLHGRGECGTDGVRPTHVGLCPAALRSPDRWPFVIIIPQKPDHDSAWIDHERMVLSVLDDAQRELSIDPARVYLSGLSQGGAGTWSLAAAHPGRFAAIAPVCGYGEGAVLASGLRGTPIWAFHGERDDVVPPQRTRDIIAALERLGARPRVTYYPEANHNSWDPAYAEPELPGWLLRHTIP